MQPIAKMRTQNDFESGKGQIQHVLNSLPQLAHTVVESLSFGIAPFQFDGFF